MAIALFPRQKPITIVTNWPICNWFEKPSPLIMNSSPHHLKQFTLWIKLAGFPSLNSYSDLTRVTEQHPPQIQRLSGDKVWENLKAQKHHRGPNISKVRLRSSVENERLTRYYNREVAKLQILKTPLNPQTFREMHHSPISNNLQTFV